MGPFYLDIDVFSYGSKVMVIVKVQENLYITDTQGTEGICPL